MSEREEHDKLADEYERGADDLQKESDELEQGIDDTRQDWEAKRRDRKVPGADPPPNEGVAADENPAAGEHAATREDDDEG